MRSNNENITTDVGDMKHAAEEIKKAASRIKEYCK
jgi:hypothetical protein